MNTPPARGQGPPSGEGPIRVVEILRRAALVLEDPTFTPAEARAGARLVLYTNSKRGFSFVGQRRLRRICHTGTKTVASAIEKLLARGHVRLVGRGNHGVTHYRPEPVGGKPTPPPASPLDRDAKPETASPLDGGAAPASASPLGSLPERASVTPCSDEIENRVGKERREWDGKKGPPLSPAALPQENGHGTATANDHGERKVSRENDKDHNRPDAEPTDPDAALRLVLGRAPSAKERSAFDQAVAGAKTAGATDALIAHFVHRATPSEGVWVGPNAARDEARRLMESWATAGIEPRRPSVAAIIKDVLFAEDYLGQTGLPSWDSGKARNEKVQAWARRETSALRAADNNGQCCTAAAEGEPDGGKPNTRKDKGL